MFLDCKQKCCCGDGMLSHGTLTYMKNLFTQKLFTKIGVVGAKNGNEIQCKS